MIIDLLTLISLGISFLTIYVVVYFFYVHYYKSKEIPASLFTKNVSVLIPAHNEQENLKKTINSIINQDFKGKIEVIVLDDGSIDDTKKIAKSFKQVRYVQVTRPSHAQGKTKTINQGIKLARHEIIGVLDADSYLDSHALQNMISEFENPKTGAVVPIVKVSNPKNLLEKMQVIEYTLSMCVRKLVSNTGALFMTHGVGTLFKKSALKEVGYFETNTLTEDLNIALKLVKKDYLVKSNFKAIGYTIVPRTAKHVLKQRLRWSGGLFENSYWFKDLFFNKNYKNLGFFILPINLVWSFVTVYIAVFWLKDLIQNAYYDVRDLIITNFDWNYFINNKIIELTTFHFNELTILSFISAGMFVLFYTIMSKQVRMNFKEALISYLTLPFYFTIFFFLNASATILTPFYLIKRGGKPWLTDKTQ